MPLNTSNSANIGGANLDLASSNLYNARNVLREWTPSRAAGAGAISNTYFEGEVVYYTEGSQTRLYRSNTRHTAPEAAGTRETQPMPTASWTEIELGGTTDAAEIITLNANTGQTISQGNFVINNGTLFVRTAGGSDTGVVQSGTTPLPQGTTAFDPADADYQQISGLAAPAITNTGGTLAISQGTNARAILDVLGAATAGAVSLPAANAAYSAGQVVTGIVAAPGYWLLLRDAPVLNQNTQLGVLTTTVAGQPLAIKINDENTPDTTDRTVALVTLTAAPEDVAAGALVEGFMGAPTGAIYYVRSALTQVSTATAVPTNSVIRIDDTDLDTPSVQLTVLDTTPTDIVAGTFVTGFASTPANSVYYVRNAIEDATTATPLPSTGTFRVDDTTTGDLPAIPAFTQGAMYEVGDLVRDDRGDDPAAGILQNSIWTVVDSGLARAASSLNSTSSQDSGFRPLTLHGFQRDHLNDNPDVGTFIAEVDYVEDIRKVVFTNHQGERWADGALFTNRIQLVDTLPATAGAENGFIAAAFSMGTGQQPPMILTLRRTNLVPNAESINRYARVNDTLTVIQGGDGETRSFVVNSVSRTGTTDLVIEYSLQSAEDSANWVNPAAGTPIQAQMFSIEPQSSVVAADGDPFPARARYNFVGDGVTVTDSNGQTQISIPGGGGGGTAVVANPTVTSTDPVISSISIGGVSYRIGLPPAVQAFNTALSGALTGTQSFLGAPFPSRQVTIRATSGTLGTTNPTITGTTATGVSPTGFTYTPPTTLGTSTVRVTSSGTNSEGTADTDTATFSVNFIYPWFVTVGTTAPTGIPAGGLQNNTWQAGRTFSTTASAAGMNAYVVVRTADATAPSFAAAGVNVAAQPTTTTFTAATRGGGNESYTVYTIADLTPGTVNWTVNTA